MKKIIIFIAVFCFGDVSSIILKIKEIENLKKNFLVIDYNIFTNKIPIYSTHKIFIEKNNLNLILYAIFNDKVNINGKWLRVGDEIEGYKVIKICNNKVILKKGNETIVLTLKSTILKVDK